MLARNKARNGNYCCEPEDSNGSAPPEPDADVPVDTMDLPAKTPVDIQFHRVTFRTSLGLWKGKKQILHEVSGRFPAAKLVAIMGPSGAGKSTLLDILSGYRITGVDGFISVDGRERQLNDFRRMSCYIQQDDRLQPLLTTWESMRIAADLKLPADTNPEEKKSLITKILQTLGLYKAKDTRAGRLSGGQKKRLSIALELINNPQVMFLDEPTTGLDSSTCRDVVTLLKLLTGQGRTIVCTIHQPSASLFQLFDQVYILARGHCVYQGTTNNLVPFLEKSGMPCPRYHNPADYVIELACGEHGEDKIEQLVIQMENGKILEWFENPAEMLIKKYPFIRKGTSQTKLNKSLRETSFLNQLGVLLRQGYIKSSRDMALTYSRVIVNILVGLMLGVLYINAGNDATRVLNNYNLMFAILIHHMMSPMMLNILSFPTELSIIIKEHFNRWYSLKSYYTAMTIVDFPVTFISCLVFSAIVYPMSGQPNEPVRFFMFFAISLLVVLVAQGVGLMIGAVLDVTNGTFVGPTISVPIMMFSGFGVRMRDLPSYMHWGTYVSYLRYGIEGYVGSIYGMNRPNLDCLGDEFCYYNRPKAFLQDVDMRADQFWIDLAVLLAITISLRLAAFLLLKYKLASIR